MPFFSGGGGFSGGTVTNSTTFSSSVQVNSLGVGVPADGTAGDTLINGGLATGGNAAPATAGDVFIGRSSGGLANILLGNSASNPSCGLLTGTDAASNPVLELRISGTNCFAIGNVYNRLRSGLSFSSLPAASASYEGALASIIDSTTATWGATITGGGANHVLAYCDGTNWTVAGK